MKPIEYVLGQTWAMTQPAIEMVVSVVERVNQEPSAVETQLGRPLDNTETVTITDGVAVVPVLGPISRYANIFTRISGGTSIEILARDFRAAVENPKVKAVVLNIDSPGGTVNGTSEFAAQVFAARDSKPIVAYGANDVCSGAYWIASACSEIVANDTSHLGSIGVVGGYPRKFDKGHYTEFVSSRARNKRPDISTEEGRAVVQAHMDAIEDVFVSSVATYRGVSDETVASDFGQGDHMIASRAVTAGMADRIGSLDGLIAELSSGLWKLPSKPKPAPNKAETQPRRAAMSEPNETPSVSVAEAAELRKQLAELQAKADEGESVKQRLAAIERDNADLKASNKRLQDERITSEARAWAEGEVRAGRASVPERESIAAIYVQAANDDAAMPAAKPRVESLKASFAARPAAKFGGQTLNKPVTAPASQDGMTVFSNDPADDDPKVPTTARQAELLKLAGLKN